uniref:tetrahydrofolate synthase n=1 Tax=Spongospora subterranea TaxID=70186 RepID=A0A0H5QPW4_9EUKA|eukprot:CRZ03451.1 hypothetical protein [Spongospora subterranea]
MASAILSLQSTGAELMSRHLSKTSAVVETRSYLRRLQLDVNRLKVVHVAGTKGKGSVSAFTDALIRSGDVPSLQRPLRTGLFTSPHLRDVRERIRIDGRILPMPDFEKRFWHVFNRLYETRHQCGDSPPMPGFFRFFTVLAVDMFLSHEVDVAIFEVGIGGLLDPTNVIESPLVCGISSIGLDHCEILGYTIASIAAQKAGIIKRHCPVVTCPQSPDAMTAIREKANSEEADLTVVSPLNSSYALGISGDHQRYNAAIAVELAKTVFRHYNREVCHSSFLKSRSTMRALRDCKWPGRCQTLPLLPNLTLFIDGAHTVDSCHACGNWFTSHSDPKAVNILVFNCCHSRNPNLLLRALNIHEKKEFAYFFSCPFQQSRPSLANMPSVMELTGQPHNEHFANSELRWQSTITSVWEHIYTSQKIKKCETKTLLNIAAVISSLKEIASSDPSKQYDVLVTGSLYLAGDVLDAINFHIE